MKAVTLQAARAVQALVPDAKLTLRKDPEAVADDIALFAGDVMGAAYHSISAGNVKPGESVAVLGLGPVGLCAVQAAVAAGAGPVLAMDTVEDRLAIAKKFGAVPVHLKEENPRDVAKQLTDGRGVAVA